MYLFMNWKLSDHLCLSNLSLVLPFKTKKQNHDYNYINIYILYFVMSLDCSHPHLFSPNVFLS